MTDGAALTISERWEVIYCFKCRIGFAVGASIRREWLADGSWFYCPNGHQQHYLESDVQRLRKQLEQANRSIAFYKSNAQSEREAREHTQRRLISQRGVTTRLKRRAKNGVCPCCTRSFANLREHMATKHPDFSPEAA